MEYCSICFEILTIETGPENDDNVSTTSQLPYNDDNLSSLMITQQEFPSLPSRVLEIPSRVMNTPTRTQKRIRECSSHFSSCQSCYTRYIQNEINNASILPTGNIHCYCPNRINCLSQITQQDILQLFHQDPTLAHLREKYHRFHHNSLVLHDQSKVWCPLPSCNGIATITKYHKAICDSCHYIFCSICTQQHSSYRLTFCQKKTNLESIQSWRSSNGGKCKKCPKCRYYIEKNGGCNHMTCTVCAHEFCWLCKSVYNSSVGCTAGRLCPLLALNKNYRWGEHLITRTISKSIAYPVLTGVACAGVGAGIGLAAIGAVTYLPYFGAKKLYQYLNPLDPSLDYTLPTGLYFDERMSLQNPGFHELNFGLEDDFLILPQTSLSHGQSGATLYERYIFYRRLSFTNEMIFHKFHFSELIQISSEMIQEFSENYFMSLEDHAMAVAAVSSHVDISRDDTMNPV